jgi:hypothetical protein
MASIFRLSPANPLQFFNQIDIFGNVNSPTANLNAPNPNYNNLEFDQDFFRRNLKPWLMQKSYAAPYQVNDVVKVQWIGKLYSGLSLGEDYIVYLLDKDGNTVKTLSVGTEIKTDDLAGGTETVYMASCLLWDVEEGVYFVQCYKRGVGSDPDYWLISEPIEVREEWKNSSLVKYKNSVNDYGLIYDMSSVVVCFQRRFFGYLSEFTPQSSFEVYENDPRDLTMLGGDAYRGWKFAVHGICDWEKDKLERIFLHDDVSIDGRTVTRESGSKLEIQPIVAMGVSNVTLSLREKDSLANLDVIDYGNIDVIDYPASKIFWVHNLMFQGTTPLTIQKFFTSKARFLAFLNNYWLSIYTHSQTQDEIYFAVDGRNKLVMRPQNSTVFGDFENTTIDRILPYWVKITTTISPANDTLITSINSTTGKYYAVAKEDNTIITNQTSLTSPTTTITRVSPTNETYYIFFNYATLVGFGGDTILTALDGELSPECLTLECELNYLTDLGTNFFNLGNGNFNFLNFYGNRLTTHSVNIILSKLYESVKNKKIASTGTIDLSYTNNSAPSTDARIYVSQLTALGWTVAVN